MSSLLQISENKESWADVVLGGTTTASSGPAAAGSGAAPRHGVTYAKAVVGNTAIPAERSTGWVDADEELAGTVAGDVDLSLVFRQSLSEEEYILYLISLAAQQKMKIEANEAQQRDSTTDGELETLNKEQIAMKATLKGDLCSELARLMAFEVVLFYIKLYGGLFDMSNFFQRQAFEEQKHNIFLAEKAAWETRNPGREFKHHYLPKSVRDRIEHLKAMNVLFMTIQWDHAYIMHVLFSKIMTAKVRLAKSDLESLKSIDMTGASQEALERYLSDVASLEADIRTYDAYNPEMDSCMPKIGHVFTGDFAEEQAAFVAAKIDADVRQSADGSSYMLVAKEQGPAGLVRGPDGAVSGIWVAPV